jgi:hypothetical protein
MRAIHVCGVHLFYYGYDLKEAEKWAYFNACITRNKLNLNGTNKVAIFYLPNICVYTLCSFW